MRKTLLSLLFFFFILFAKAQQKLPAFNYVPQAPTTEAFTRYGDIPVDLSTGVTSINIPIYNLNENGINIPISISYHASGIKVHDIASSVGLGWTLNAGGIITRTIIGKKDEYVVLKKPNGDPIVTKPPFRNTMEFVDYNNIKENQNLQQWSDQMYKQIINSQYWDFYSDRFFYNLGNGESGVFRMDYAHDDFKFMPYKPMKVRLIEDVGVYMGLKIEMTTGDGTRYLFRKNRYDTWHPEKIYNSSNTDSVVFYTHADTISVLNYNISEEFGAYRSCPLDKMVPWIDYAISNCHRLNVSNDNLPSGVMINGTFQEDEIVLVDSIVSTNGVIRFTYARDRQDAEIETRTVLSRLVKIQVVNRSTGLVIKNVDLLQNYSGSERDNKRLMLTALQTGASGEEKHEFKYNPQNLPPYFIIGGGYSPTFMQDFWGYYQYPGSNSLLFKDFTPSGHTNLYPDEERTRACMLTEIKYPTGEKRFLNLKTTGCPLIFMARALYRRQRMER